MRKITSETDDWLRSEYRREDLGDFVQGKYPISEVEFAQLVALLMAMIGEDNDIQIEPLSKSNHLARRTEGDWTYELDHANQISLHYWQSEFTSIVEHISNPPCVTTDLERQQLQRMLSHHVRALKAKVS